MTVDFSLPSALSWYIHLCPEVCGLGFRIWWISRPVHDHLVLDVLEVLERLCNQRVGVGGVLVMVLMSRLPLLSRFLSIPRSFTRSFTMANPRDPNTLSNYNNWRSTHITANFDILFDQKKLAGNVVHKFKSITDAQSREIILDTSHLDIGSVKVDGQSSKWELMTPLEPFGTPLKITLDQGVKLNGFVEVDV